MGVPPLAIAFSLPMNLKKKQKCMDERQKDSNINVGRGQLLRERFFKRTTPPPEKTILPSL